MPISSASSGTVNRSEPVRRAPDTRGGAVRRLLARVLVDGRMRRYEPCPWHHKIVACATVWGLSLLLLLIAAWLLGLPFVNVHTGR
jgi:hypothetical protein